MISTPIPLPKRVLQTSDCTHFFYGNAIQPVLGMGMGVNGAAQSRSNSATGLTAMVGVGGGHGLQPATTGLAQASPKSRYRWNRQSPRYMFAFWVVQPPFMALRCSSLTLGSVAGGAGRGRADRGRRVGDYCYY